MEVKDVGTIMKIAMAVISLFNLNNFQQVQLNNYVKNNMYIWAEERRHSSEIEAMIKSEASRISR